MSSASETIYIGVKDEETALQQPRGSIAPHLLILVVQIAALVGPRFRGRQEVTCITIVALSVLCHFNQFTNDIGLANLFALAWPHYLLTLANFLFTSADGPEADLWRVDRKPREAMSFPAFSLRKIKWALATLISLRGIRWNYEVRNVPKRVRSWEREGKVRFLLLQLVDLAWMVLMADLLSQLGLRFFFTDPVTDKLYTNSKYLSIRSSDLLWSLAKSFVYGAGPYFFINMQYIVCSILAISIGLSKPEVNSSFSFFCFIAWPRRYKADIKPKSGLASTIRKAVWSDNDQKFLEQLLAPDDSQGKYSPSSCVHSPVTIATGLNFFFHRHRGVPRFKKRVKYVLLHSSVGRICYFWSHACRVHGDVATAAQHNRQRTHIGNILILHIPSSRNYTGRFCAVGLEARC